MSEPKKAINVYTCPAGHRTVTINRDEGITPFVIDCRSPVGCPLHAQSGFCREKNPSTPAQWEWYRPSEDELRVEIDRAVKRLNLTEPDRIDSLEKSFRDHDARGGMLLRRIDAVIREMIYGYRTRRG